MKRILDACCGSRMFWFNKSHPDVVFQDIRYEDLDLNHGNRTCHIRPDKIGDFRKMDFPDNTFWHVIFDPPHWYRIGPNSYMAKKYGKLERETWREDLKAGFDECMRVLKPNGTLIFKWSESQIKVSEIIKVLGKEPLYGHRTLATSKTIWMAFMKDAE